MLGSLINFEITTKNKNLEAKNIIIFKLTFRLLFIYIFAYSLKFIAKQIKK